jgi:phosphotransferase system HPr (HPr) family protein
VEARRKVKIVNRQGLHARPCHSIVSTALAHASEVRIRATGSGPEVNGKSILELMTLSASAGTEIEVRAWGSDAETLVNAVCGLIERGFGEEI